MADYAGTNNMKVVIWKDIFTDSIIYQKFGLTPDYVDSLNGFALYNCDQLVPVSGTIYVGVVFQLDKNYNLGVDLNTDNHTNNFAATFRFLANKSTRTVIYDTPACWRFYCVCIGTQATIVC